MNTIVRDYGAQRILEAARADDVIWVPCRGCTDLAGCEERWECLTLGVLASDGGLHE